MVEPIAARAAKPQAIAGACAPDDAKILQGIRG